MYVDAKLLMADSHTFSSASTTVYGDTSIYLGSSDQYRDISKGQPIAVVFVVETAFASSGSATEQFKVFGATGADIEGGTVIAETGAIAYTSLTAGKVIVVPLPTLVDTTLDYIGVGCTTAGATSTAGAVSAFIAFDW